MYDPPRILALIQERMDELGISQTQLGQLAFGKPNASAFQAIRSGSSPAVDRLEAMANALGMELYFGPRRVDPGLAEATPQSDLGKTEALRANYLPIPWVQMGRKGHRPPLAVTPEFLSARHLKPENIRAFEPDQDWTGLGLGQVTTLIDVEATRLAAGAPQLVAWSKGGRTYVGLLQLVGQHAACMSPEYHIGAADLGPARSLHILGKVVLFGVTPIGAQPET